jgi:hypothetical protein
MRKATRLRNLSIDSVDSVDKGAGHGVEVVLRKRDERNSHMDNSTPLLVCKKAQDAANEGRVSQYALNELMRAVADTHFGGSMAKMLELDAMGRPVTTFGKIFLSPRTGRTTAYEEAELHKREFAKRGATIPDVPNRPGPATGGKPADWNEGPGENSRDQVGDDPDSESNESNRPVRTRAPSAKPRVAKALNDRELTKIYRAHGE